MEIKNTKDITATKLNTLIIGESGSGKTTLASTLDLNNTLIVSLESGLLSLKNFKINYVEIVGSNGVEKINHLRSILGEIAQSDYTNIYYDSLSEIAGCFVELADAEFPDIRQSMLKWKFYNEVMTKFIKYNRDLDKNIFYTCLQKVTQDELSRRYILPDLSGSIASKLPAYMDLVVNLRVIEKEDKKVRALLTETMDGYACKDRSGELDTYEKPDLQSILTKIFNGK